MYIVYECYKVDGKAFWRYKADAEEPCRKYIESAKKNELYKWGRVEYYIACDTPYPISKEEW